jgi:intracellular multiplication protein IcmQ
MNTQEYIELRDKLLASFDEALSKGDWEASLFFRTIGKRLKEMRQLIIDEMPIETENSAQKFFQASSERHADLVKIYVSIYQTDWSNLDRWRSTVKALADYSVSRPVYRDEEHVKALLRAKPDKRREAYVVTFVKPTDILPQSPGRVLTDRLGHELLTLKDNCIQLENIVEFVHEDKRYGIRYGDFVLA